MQKLILSKLASKSKYPEFSAEQLGSGALYQIQSELTSVEGWQGHVEIGQKLSLTWSGKVYCACCSLESKKLVNGFCFECLNTKAAADSCIMSPHLCHYLSGTCREPEWGLSFCYQPHVVYLSYTGDFKVGITRLGQIPVRWFDQGATWAQPLAVVGSRHQAGIIEKILSKHMSDRTVWQKMLKSGNERPSAERIAEWSERVAQICGGGLAGGCESARMRVSSPPRAPWAGAMRWLESPSQFELSHAAEPLESLPQTLTFEKVSRISDMLLGIKGQYLIYENGVFNVRRHEGFEVMLSVGDTGSCTV